MRVIDWFRQSNRWKHLAGGFMLGVIPSCATAGLYGGIVAASTLEFKDKSYGSKWDWTDWSLTVAGTIIGCVVRGFINHLAYE